MADDSSGTRFDNIMNRLEEAWNAWSEALGGATDSDASTTQALMVETAQGDEDAVEVIRSLVEGNTYQQLPGPDDVDDADDLDDARRIMAHHHERLLGALDTVAETAEDVVAAVEERIAPITWEQYPKRVERLGTSGDSGR